MRSGGMVSNNDRKSSRTSYWKWQVTVIYRWPIDNDKITGCKGCRFNSVVQANQSTCRYGSRRVLQKDWRSHKEERKGVCIIVIGGWNAVTGKGIEDVVERFGLNTMNERGNILFDFCWQNSNKVPRCSNITRDDAYT